MRTQLGRKAASLRKQALLLKGKKQQDSWEKASVMEEAAAQELIGRVPVIASTCVSAGLLSHWC